MTKKHPTKHKSARVWNPQARNWMYPKKLKGEAKLRILDKLTREAEEIGLYSPELTNPLQTDKRG